MQLTNFTLFTPMSQLPYRILQVLPAFDTGGVEQGTFDIAHALVKENHHAFIASQDGRMIKDLPQSNCRHIFMDLNTKNPFKIFENSRSLKKLIQDEHIDLVHARSRAPAWSAYLACRQTNTPYITTFHAAYGHQNAFKKCYNSVMAKGERIIAISDFIANHIFSQYSKYLPDAKVETVQTIHRGIDCQQFDPKKVAFERLQNLKKEWGLLEDTPLILLPARLTRIKGHITLIKALKQLKIRDYTCVIVGQPARGSNYHEELRKLIAHLGLEDKVKLIGHCQDMPAANLLADVVIVPSLVPEGFGRTMAEAGAMGVPVIASNIGAAPEIVEHGKTGWLIPPGDAENLAKHIDIALSMTSQQKEALAQNAQKRIRELFSKEVMCQKTLEVYAQVIEAKKQGKREASTSS